MNIVRTFLAWLVKCAGKPETLLLKTDQQAEEFVARIARQQPEPNAELKNVFAHYRAVQKDGIRIAPRVPASVSANRNTPLRANGHA